MLVKLKVSRVGNHFTQQAGQIVDVSHAEATALLERGQGEAVEVPAGGKQSGDSQPEEPKPKRGRPRKQPEES